MASRRGQRATLQVERREGELDAAVEALLGLCGGARPRGAVLVATAAGQVLGVAVFDVSGPEAELRAVVTEPSARFRGVGRFLVLQVAARARAAGCSCLRVHVPRIGDAALGFFRGLGFDETHVALDLSL